MEGVEVYKPYLYDMKYRPLDENGDMTLGEGVNYLEGIDAIRQALDSRLRTYKGEWWEGDDDSALPLFTEIMGLPRTEANREKIDLMVIDRIIDTVGVLAVTNVASEYTKERKNSFRCTVNTVYGSTSLEVVL